MSSRAFIVDRSRILRPLDSVEFSHEFQLDEYVEKHPELLAAALSSDERQVRLLLVETQAAIDDADEGHKGRWAADALFLDDSGIPTIVEDKLSGNPEIRRKIIGQMIEYAANFLVTITVDGLQQRLRAACAKRGADPDESLAEFLGAESEEESDKLIDGFWSEVEQNLQAERIRLAFVADQFPATLRRAIAFLNSQMNPTEVVGIDIRRMREDDGDGTGVEVLVSTAIGVTERKRQTATGAPKQEPRSLEEFRAEFAGMNDTTAIGIVALRLLDELLDQPDVHSLLDFRCYQTPTAGYVCQVQRRKDGLKLLDFRPNLRRGRRSVSVPNMAMPGPMRMSLVSLLGREPTPKGGHVAEWCAEHPGNPSKLVEWVLRQARGKDAATEDLNGPTWPNPT